jgi:putative acetyltransferase
VEIRTATGADADAIRTVQLAAFGDHGGVVNPLIDALRGTIATTDRSEYVATDGDEVIGHVMFSRSLLDAPDRLLDVQVLSPIGVLPDHQRRGVGKALIEHGIAALIRQDVPLVFLEGDPAYYSRRGFVAGAGLKFRRPSLRIPDAAFQVMALPTYEPWMTGTLVYAHAFWDHDAVGLRD